MIGKIIIGKSFKGCISYCLDDKLLHSQEVAFKNRAEILTFNQCFGNSKELIQQFNEVRQLNPKLSKPVLHITLSLAPGEKLDKGALCKLVEDCAEKFEFDKNQFIAVSHADTSHQHLHIVANRIGFDKKTLSDSNNYKKMASYCREIEQKYGLKQVISPRRFLLKEMRQIPRLDTRKEAIKNDLRACILPARNYGEFKALMKSKNYRVIKSRGIAFVDSKGVYVKGSELGYSLARIEKILELSQVQKQSILFKPKEQKGLLQRQGKKSDHSKQESLSRNASKNMNIGRTQMLEALLKPAPKESNIPFELMKKKKKIYHSQHL
jgi:Relaxase/Mobilisation nuclease domain